MKPVDMVVLILTIPVAILIITATVFPMFTGRVISESKAQLLGDLVNQVIAIVLVYVGYKLRGSDD